MKTIQEQIKERAEAQYPQDESINRQMNNRIIEPLRDAYQQGAESMLPMMRDIACKYQIWIEIDSFPENIDEWFQSNKDKNYYDYFMNFVYKPNLEK